MSNDATPENTKSSNPPTDTVMLRIQEALKGLRFGSLNIIVQDGYVIQLDRVEKIRLPTSHKRKGNK